MTRAGFIAIVGPPNAGKSTLVNRLVGAKVSIVSPKPQTTRTRIAAILTEGEAQAVFVDLPGVFAPRRRLDRAMVDAAWRGLADADLAVLVVDAAAPDPALEMVERVQAEAKIAILALNKIDLVPRGRLLEISAAFNRTHFAATFMISAENGDGIDDLKREALARLPAGPWLYDEDQLTDLPQRLMAAETTREQVFRQLHQELPYDSYVETERWTEMPDGSVRIDQVLNVRREGQRKIAIGAGGARVKEIGAKARAELEQFLGRRVHLFLTVKVAENWDDRRELFANWGLEYEA